MSWDFLTFVPNEILDQFSNKMLHILLNRSFARLYEILPPDDQKLFDEFLKLDEVNEEELLRRTAFLEQHGVVFKKVLLEEAHAIEEEFADFVEKQESKE
ncbi:MAG: hypothetical protein HZA36_01800 [Parcubacteria group bacterium]|nr:hypothetical protein [Parcubacteria group bacterium]